jgi:hypothetical protein
LYDNPRHVDEITLRDLEERLMVIEEPLVTIPHEEHSELQVLEERYDAEGFDYAPVLHCGDHE